jgi:hypothetical protein
MATRITNQKLSKSSRAWMREHLDDHFVKKAQKKVIEHVQLISYLKFKKNITSFVQA